MLIFSRNPHFVWSFSQLTPCILPQKATWFRTGPRIILGAWSSSFGWYPHHPIIHYWLVKPWLVNYWLVNHGWLSSGGKNSWIWTWGLHGGRFASGEPTGSFHADHSGCGRSVLASVGWRRFFHQGCSPWIGGFPYWTRRNSLHFFLKSKTSEGLQGLGYWSHRFFSQSWWLKLKRRVQWVQSMAGFRCDLHCRNGHQVDCSGADLGSGSPDMPWR